MTKKMIILAAIIGAMSAQSLAAATSKGRIVVFADKKEGDFKTDKSIRTGTSESLEGLKLVDKDKGIHACFIGTAENIKPILTGMIANTNKFDKSDKQAELKLKSFESAKGPSSSIHLEVTSDSNKSVYLQLNIDPC